MRKPKNIDVMKCCHFISFLENSAIISWVWSTTHTIVAVLLTVEYPKLSLPRTQSRSSLSKICLCWSDKRERIVSLRNLDTKECWFLHPCESEASLWSRRISPVAHVQDFAFCLRGLSKFQIGVGLWCSWSPFPVHAGSQTSLPWKFCLTWTIQTGECQHPRLNWSAAQEIQDTAGQTWLSSRIPLMTWSLPLWTSLTFLVRSTSSYIPCCKTHIMTRHTQRSQTLSRNFLQDFILKVPQRRIGKISYFYSLVSEEVVAGLDELFQFVDGCLYLRVAPWCHPLVLASYHPLRVTQRALVLSSGTLLFKFSGRSILWSSWLHIWELLDNYRNVGVIMSIYLFHWRTRRILIVTVYFHKVYIHIQ